MFTINLNKESAAVLLRCLAYGKDAVSQAEGRSGVAQVMTDNIDLIRTKVCQGLANCVIAETALNSSISGGMGEQKPLVRRYAAGARREP